MSKGLLPLKFSVFRCIAEAEKPVTAIEIMTALEADYGSEGQFKRKRIQVYLDSLLGVTMIRVAGVEFDQNGELSISYVVSPLGRERMKYIPQ